MNLEPLTVKNCLGKKVYHNSKRLVFKVTKDLHRKSIRVPAISNAELWDPH